MVVLAALLAPRPFPVSTAGRLALAGLALLCVWTALSITWAPIAGRAQDDLQRLLLYLGVFAAALALLRQIPVRRALEPALALGAFVVIAYGLSERLLPGVIDLDQSGSRPAGSSSRSPTGTPTGSWLPWASCWRCGWPHDPNRSRALRSGMAAPRGTRPRRVPQLRARRPGRGCGGAAGAGGPRSGLTLAVPQPGHDRRAAALASLVASGLTTVTSLEDRDSGEGLLMLAVLVAAARRRVHGSADARGTLKAPSLPVSRPATVAGVTLLVLVVGGLVLAAFEGKPEGASPVAGADPACLGSIDTNRYRYWEVASRNFADHPIEGLGSGGFQAEWLKTSDRVDASGDAHSLYLETAAELGVVGLALAALPRRRGRRPGPAVPARRRGRHRRGRRACHLGLSCRPRLGLGNARGDAARAVAGRRRGVGAKRTRRRDPLTQEPRRRKACYDPR